MMTAKANRPVIFFARTNARIKEWLPLLRYLNQEKRNPVLLFIQSPYNIHDEVIKSLQEEGISYVNYEAKPAPAATRITQWLMAGLQKLQLVLDRQVYPWTSMDAIRYHLSVFLQDLLAIWRMYHRYRHEIGEAKRIVDELDPSLMVVGTEARIGFYYGLYRYGQQKNIPTLIKIAEAQNTKNDNIAYINQRGWAHNQALQKSLLAYLIAWLYPQLLLSTGGQHYLHYDFRSCLTQFFISGHRLKTPWDILERDFKTVVAVNNEREYQDLLAAQPCKDRLVLTGRAMDDDLYAGLQQRTTRRQGLRERLKFTAQHLIVLAMPQLAEHNYSSWEEHWQQVEFILAVLCQIEGAQVILCLHPRMERARYAYLADKFPVHMGEEPTHFWIPLSDLYVAAQSTTLEWAFACGIPCINLACWIRLSRYENVPGVVVVEQLEDLEATMQGLMSSSAAYTQLKQLAEANATQWGLLDGHSTERIANLIGDLTRI